MYQTHIQLLEEGQVLLLQVEMDLHYQLFLDLFVEDAGELEGEFYVL